MNAEEKEEIRTTVEHGVTQAMTPIWEKVRTHDTDIALLIKDSDSFKQDSKQSLSAQTAQGVQLGEVEKRGEKHSLYWKVLWIGLLGFVGFVGWLVTKLITILAS